MKLPIDMRQNLLSIFALAMDNDGIGDFWQQDYTINDRLELIERVVDLAVAVVKLDKILIKAKMS